MTIAQKPRIAVAGFQHETNTFAPVSTGFADFLDGGGWPPLTKGAAVLETFAPLNIPLGGFVSAAREQAELVPILWTNAEPASHVSTEAFQQISGMILDALREAEPLDGIYLDLHGAMVTEHDQDGEGALLRQIRDLCGDEIPLAVSLDLHANISPAMVALSDVITIYRTYPHLDMDATGARAWAQLSRILRTGSKPAKSFRQGSRLIPLSAQCTDFGPIQTLYDELAAVPNDAATADIALGFPLSDVHDCGPSVVAYARSQQAADHQADRLVAALERATDAVENPLLSPQDAVRQAIALTQSGGSVVLADVQDNSGAGAMSDSTGLLAALLAGCAANAVLGTLWDKETALQAHAAGLEAHIDVSIGGRFGPEGVTPLQAKATVLALSDGTFTCTGAMQRDVETDIGPTALIGLGSGLTDVQVVISSRRHQTIDQAVFRHLGVDPAAKRIVAVKSTVHYRADFAPLAKQVLMVRTPGYSFVEPQHLTFTNLRPELARTLKSTQP